jgi:hypothetical protein
LAVVCTQPVGDPIKGERRIRNAIGNAADDASEMVGIVAIGVRGAMAEYHVFDDPVTVRGFHARDDGPIGQRRDFD